MLSSYWNHIIAIIIMCYAAEPFTFFFLMKFNLFWFLPFSVHPVSVCLFFFFLDCVTLYTSVLYISSERVENSPYLPHWLNGKTKQMLTSFFFNLFSILLMLFICSRINLGPISQNKSHETAGFWGFQIVKFVLGDRTLFSMNHMISLIIYVQFFCLACFYALKLFICMYYIYFLLNFLL